MVDRNLRDYLLMVYVTHFVENRCVSGDDKNDLLLCVSSFMVRWSYVRECATLKIHQIRREGTLSLYLVHHAGRVAVTGNIILLTEFSLMYTNGT